jgi:hypothetical protein
MEEKKTVDRILVGEAPEKRSFGRPRRRCQDNIKIRSVLVKYVVRMRM